MSPPKVQKMAKAMQAFRKSLQEVKRGNLFEDPLKKVAESKAMDEPKTKSPLSNPCIFQKRDVTLIERSDIKLITKPPLGRGTYGSVYKGTWNQKEVSIKSMEYLKNPDDDNDILREVLVAQALDHENFIKVYGVCLEANLESPTFHIVMEYFDCDNLYEVLFMPEIKKIHKFDLFKKVHVARQICIGITYLHSKAVLHRDIKPTNILIGYPKNDNFYECFVKLCDFGLSKCTKISKSVASIMASNRTRCIGTYQYMAPEVLRPKKFTPYQKVSDIWSLSATLYELFSEAKVWKVKVGDKTEFVEIHSKVMLPDFTKIPDDFQEIIERGMSYNLALRPSALDLLQEFEDWIDSYDLQ